MPDAIARDEIARKLQDLLRHQEEVHVDVEAVREDTPLDDIGFDSLSILDFMYEIEDCFGIHLEVKELLELDKVGDLVAHIEGKLVG